jgi:hypothetical protein
MKSHKSKSIRLLLPDVFHVNSKTVFCSLCSLQLIGLCIQVKQSISCLALCIASCLHGVTCCKWVNIRCFGCQVFHQKRVPSVWMDMLTKRTSELGPYWIPLLIVANRFHPQRQCGAHYQVPEYLVLYSFRDHELLKFHKHTNSYKFFLSFSKRVLLKQSSFSLRKDIMSTNFHHT